MPEGKSEWQPIETAPKGKPVFLRGPRGGKIRASYTMTMWGVLGWFTREKGELVLVGSTHWQPIPRSSLHRGELNHD